MDIKKSGLYIGIVIVVILLWNAWIKDNAKYQQHAVPTPNVATATHTYASAATQATAKTATPAATKPAAPISGKTIHIQTDVVRAAINTSGGVITKMQLLKYPVALNQKNNPVTLLNDYPETKYLSFGGVMNKGQADPIVYQVSQTRYTLSPNQNVLTVKLFGKTASGINVTKSFIFARDSYNVHIHYQITNHTSSVWVGQLYNQISRVIPPKGHGFLHYTTFTGAAFSTPEEHYQKYKFSNLVDEPVNQIAKGGWAAMVQHYFISAIVPPANQTSHYYSKVSDDGLYSIGLLGPNLLLKPGETISSNYQFYSGPSVNSRLQAVAPYLNLTIDFGWAWFISIVIFWLLLKVHTFVGNWGWSIVIVTLIIKALFYKLSASSYRSMARMRKLQPKIQALKEQYGDDRSKLGQATMEFYKKEKINPLGGCLPIVVQMPVFIALYYVLIESVQLRQAPFILWIHNLTQPDPYFILPVLMGLTMFLQQKLSPAPPDPTQAKVMLFLPVIMTVLFLYFPAGLVLYWLVNNIVSITQQWYVMKTIDKHPVKKKTKKWQKK